MAHDGGLDFWRFLLREASLVWMRTNVTSDECQSLFSHLSDACCPLLLGSRRWFISLLTCFLLTGCPSVFLVVSFFSSLSNFEIHFLFIFLSISQLFYLQFHSSLIMSTAGNPSKKRKYRPQNPPGPDRA
ncbi:hypothetical protein Hanom_Chr17g01560541 [Helianthus anomalus]